MKFCTQLLISILKFLYIKLKLLTLIKLCESTEQMCACVHNRGGECLGNKKRERGRESHDNAPINAMPHFPSLEHIYRVGELGGMLED